MSATAIANQSACGGDMIGALWMSLTEDFLGHARTTPERLAKLLTADPHHVLGWCAKGFFSILLARREMQAPADEALRMARRALMLRGGTRRERDYVLALGEAASGHFAKAAVALDLIQEADPDDSFAPKLSHALRFMLGDSRSMHAAIHAAVARIDPAHPHLGYLMGCQAFALEENGRYADAERIGREAVLRAPRDAWGVHAVAHVHEMTGQARAGVEWLTTHEGNIGHCNNFGGHVFWHLALFRLELGDAAGALALYDSRVRAERTEDFRDIANAASLLGRLAIEGVVVGDRWEELADIAERRISDHSLVFAELHYALALAGAGRSDKAAALADALEAAEGSREQDHLARAIGATMADAIRAWGQGEHARAAAELLATRSQRQRIGGSHAQRDIFEQITIDALIKSGRRDEARMLLGERLAARSRNRFAEQRLSSAFAVRRPISGSAGVALSAGY
ncbi:tetratricopeptide repeat protein [Terrarubrum flagellatum]|uniref:tetratricopeptide repeat protein n=1 Tax=Terrirubrum flagellatum TaxID=2895980 RepID=UPI00314543E2